ncbi:hypothetical protein [Flammeovirga kamogawensis]|uniref:DUF4595 domain-containing protein n=1 Tax=Flammeovirga kamogawensis TaxID=373891 RepID=A0ABX8H321_9BACT|nr:hypothetical protein [Flammeovirga kamogawensis]MBB6463306.1 hypothetical protein [Flammeovirga kamogawensis]QWG09545.1 hypothetical protein KM029_23340 [Flammeovirga kamogawensis]TRX65059.1 hypothetical protein EO216_21235 [Flammeovirga kamogawensis]
MFKHIYIISLISVLFFSCTNDKEEIIPEEPVVIKKNIDVPFPVVDHKTDEVATSKFNAKDYRLNRIESNFLGINISFEYDDDNIVIGGVVEGFNYQISYDSLDRIVKIEVDNGSIYEINYLASHEIHLKRTDIYNYNHIFKYVVNDDNQVINYRYQLEYAEDTEDNTTFFDMNYYYDDLGNVEHSLDNKDIININHKFDTEIDNPYASVKNVLRFLWADAGKHILVEVESKNRVAQWYASDYYIYTESDLSLNIKLENQKFEQELYFEKI